ncbi:hypothetical protein COCMIDRAFT_84328 [Bipolaris oryzae ATCC 44560]|uniref:Uncharacterized protein n=1 Tax=Bipolaris oryzae ATCC 44560 TaxID=930090 RepID=W6ZHX0_COCMI|nr:uncharacterized protein COCMIDRAFT_84328 [Bipolaris oryzae ATCC 44560]EUC49590.1 hypothetical protein COCMIDRAFT_84328 [Bipolaris oryzae ATCC 44560]
MQALSSHPIKDKQSNRTLGLQLLLLSLSLSLSPLPFHAFHNRCTVLLAITSLLHLNNYSSPSPLPPHHPAHLSLLCINIPSSHTLHYNGINMFPVLSSIFLLPSFHTSICINTVNFHLTHAYPAHWLTYLHTNLIQPITATAMFQTTEAKVTTPLVSPCICRHLP